MTEIVSKIIPSPDLATLTDLKQCRTHLLTLLARFAYQEGQFLLSSGQKSSYYINCKPVTLSAQGALLVGRLIWPQLPSTTEAIAGLTLGADPLVTAVSLISALEKKPIPALIVRKHPKGHGTQTYLEGPTLPPKSPVVVLEDVVTTGKSALLAVERVRDAGYQVAQIIALVDRNQGGAQLYQDQGLSFQSLFQLTEIQQVWRQMTDATL